MQIWDATGKKLLDTSDRVLRILGTVYCYEYMDYDTSGNLQVYTNLPTTITTDFSTGTPWWFWQGEQNWEIVVNISGNNLSISKGQNYSFAYFPLAGFVYYGVY